MDEAGLGQRRGAGPTPERVLGLQYEDPQPLVGQGGRGDQAVGP